MDPMDLETELAKPLSPAQLRDMIRHRQSAINELVLKNRRIVQLIHFERENVKEIFDEEKKRLEIVFLEQLRELKRRNLELEMEISQKKSNFAEKSIKNSGEHEKAAAELAEALRAMEAHAKSEEERAIATENKLREETRKFEEMSSKFKKLAQISKTLRDQNMELQKKCQNSDEVRFRETIRKLQSEASETKDKIETLTTNLEECASRYNGSAQAISLDMIQLQQSAPWLKGGGGSDKALQALLALQEAEKEIETLKITLSKSKKESKEALEEAKNEINRLKDISNRCQNQAETAKNEQIELQSELTNICNELNSAKSELNKLKSNEKKILKENSKLKAEITSFHMALEEIHTSCKDLRLKLVTAEMENSRIREELEKATKEGQKLKEENRHLSQHIERQGGRDVFSTREMASPRGDRLALCEVACPRERPTHDESPKKQNCKNSKTPSARTPKKSKENIISPRRERNKTPNFGRSLMTASSSTPTDPRPIPKDFKDPDGGDEFSKLLASMDTLGVGTSTLPVTSPFLDEGLFLAEIGKLDSGTWSGEAINLDLLINELGNFKLDAPAPMVRSIDFGSLLEETESDG